MEMKKSLLLLVAVAALSSCNISNNCPIRKTIKGSEKRVVTSVRTTQPFDKIEIKAACDVHYNQSNTYSVKVVGDETLTKSIITRFDGSTLVINANQKSISLFRIGNRKKPTVYVSSPDILSIRMEGAGDFCADQTIDTDTLTVFLKGVGDVDFKHILCDEFHGTMLGVGDFDIKSLTSQRSNIQLKGVGDIDVHFENSGSATCTIEGVGDVTLSGNLKSLQRNVRGTGDIDTDKLHLGR